MDDLPAARDAAVVVRPRGDIDREATAALRDTVARALALDPPALVVDMGDVAFIDSIGLSVLAAARTRMGEGQRLLLCNLSPRVHRVLLVTAFDRLADLHVVGQPWPWPDVEPGLAR